jgi:hypothetical protein
MKVNLEFTRRFYRALVKNDHDGMNDLISVVVEKNGVIGGSHYKNLLGPGETKEPGGYRVFCRRDDLKNFSLHYQQIATRRQLLDSEFSWELDAVWFPVDEEGA